MHIINTTVDALKVGRGRKCVSCALSPKILTLFDRVKIRLTFLRFMDFIFYCFFHDIAFSMISLFQRFLFFRAIAFSELSLFHL